MKTGKRILSLYVCFILIFSIVGYAAVPVSASSMPFTDVASNNEYYEAIEYVYDRGIMQGTTATTFEPDASITRGMVVTILYRMSGSDMQRAPTGFTDVSSSKYYYYPVGWAQYHGIVEGFSDTEFRPDSAVQKEHLLTILYRYATNYMDYSYTLVSSNYSYHFDDSSSITSPCRSAVNWAANCGIVQTESGNLNPTHYAPRKLCALYIHRLLAIVLGYGKSYAMRDLSVGTSEQIAEIIDWAGYRTCHGYDLTPRAMEFAFYNSRVLFSHSHGSDTRIQLDGGYLNASDIQSGKMSDMKLVYISACYAGGTFARTLHETGGAQMAIGFTGEILASTSTNGIHEFNELFFDYLLHGKTISEAWYLADQESSDNYPVDTGAGNMMPYGTYNGL